MVKKVMPITHKKGLQANLPLLEEAEFGFTTDEKRIFIGTNDGNMEIAKRDKVLRIKEKLTEIDEDLYDFGMVSNLTITQDNKGELFTLNWTNTDKTLNYQGVEVYVAEIDLSSKSYEQTVEDAIKIYDGVGATTTYVTKPNITYHFKIYTRYNVFEKVKYGEGVHGRLLAVDNKPPDDVTKLTIKTGDTKATLNWTNTNESDLSEVVVVYKTGSYPTSKTDGTIAYTGLNNTVTINNLVNETVYYFVVYSQDTNGNTSTGVQINGTPKAYQLYGVKINTTNSNTESALSYIEMSEGFTPARMGTTEFNYGSWKDKFPFNEIKPCLVSNGTVVGYLNPNDYSKFIDGTTADITSGSSGDVMVEFPKIWWKFETVGNDLFIRYSDIQIDSGYKCLAHMRGTTEKDKVYISAYLGTEVSSKLRSLSGKTPTASQTISQFRTLAQSNGNGYDQMAYYQLLMLQVLYIVMFKDRDSQTALGQGYTALANSTATTTGGLNQKGLFYGETTGKVQMKFCGVEDFYGNLYYWIDGLFSDLSRNMLIGNQSFNDTGSNYTNYGQGATANLGGYINSVQGGTETGFIIKGQSGSATTYYPDLGYLNAFRIAIFGGYWYSASAAGAFFLHVSYSASSYISSIGARLMFC